MASGTPSAYVVFNAEGVVCYYTNSNAVAQRAVEKKPGWTVVRVAPIEEMKETK